MIRTELATQLNKQIILATYTTADETIEYNNFDIIILLTPQKYINQKLQNINLTIIDIVDEDNLVFRRLSKRRSACYPKQIPIQHFYVTDHICDDIDFIDENIIVEFRNIINTLPHEIIYQWVNKNTFGTCKLWRKLWRTKPMSVTLYRVVHKYNDDLIDLEFEIGALLKFKNLITLNLGQTNGDVTLKLLTTLRTLRINNNNCIGDETLRYLTNISSLSLMRNKKITIKSLRYLTKMTSLELYENYIIPDATLKTLTNLTKLDIENNCLITDDSLKCLLKINDLTLGNNHNICYRESISDESLMCLTNITCLSITNCKLITDKSIKKLTNMTQIFLHSAHNIGYGSLKYLTNLSTMYLQNRVIGHELRKMTNLSSLIIGDGTTITGVSIKFLTKLESLKIYGNVDITLEEISKLTNLKKLKLNNCSRARKNKIKIMFPNIILQD